jgi:hypothetical protein
MVSEFGHHAINANSWRIPQPTAGAKLRHQISEAFGPEVRASDMSACFQDPGAQQASGKFMRIWQGAVACSAIAN